jgi:hypothetical protein
MHYKITKGERRCDDAREVQKRETRDRSLLMAV